MKWQEGQRVECASSNWGICYITMSNPDIVVIYCSRFEMVITGSPEQLELAGWYSIDSQKVIYITEWTQNHRQQQSKSPTS